MNETATYTEQIEARLNEWSARLEKLETALTNAQTQGRSGTGDLLVLVNKLRREESQIRESIRAIHAAPEQDRQRLETDANQRMDRLQTSFDEAITRLPPD